MRVLAFVLLLVALAMAEDTSGGDASLGGPTSVPGQLASDHAASREASLIAAVDELLSPYFEFKERLHSDTGLKFGLDYTALFFAASSSPGEGTAASGIARFFGFWQLVDRDGPNPGLFVFKGEYRHGLGTDVSPNRFGFEVGYDGIPGVAFANRDWLLTNLYWSQQFASGHVAIDVGVIDTTDSANVYGLLSPWTDFTNLVFSTGDTIPSPDQGLGCAVRWRITEHWYLQGGIADANGNPADPADMFQSFFDTAEYHTFAEAGWIESWDKRHSDNIHVTFWHADAREEAGTPSGWGMNFSWCRKLTTGWEPFVRLGFSEDGGALSEYSVSVGTGYAFADPRSFVGVGANWGRPSAETFGPGLRDQYVVEAYYRFQATKIIAITPIVQVLVDPASNPGEDVIALFGIRGRINF